MKSTYKNPIDIAQKIKSLRKEVNWSQSELAKNADIRPSAISMIESKQRNPSLTVLRKISEALKISVSELTGESTPKEVDLNAQAFFRQFKDLNDLEEVDKNIILDLAKSLKERNNGKSRN